jgi:AcrR family transcriptional regulator
LADLGIGTSAGGRKRGRSKKLDAAITEATLRLLSRDGPSGVSIDAIAREVGCSRSSIYRRHGSKEALILAVSMEILGEPVERVEGHLLESVTAIRAGSFHETASALAMTMFMDEAIRGTELGRRYLSEVFLTLRQDRMAILQEAVEKGEIRADADIDLLLDAVSGTLLFRRAHHLEPEPDLSVRLAALLLDGVRVR